MARPAIERLTRRPEAASRSLLPALSISIRDTEKQNYDKILSKTFNILTKCCEEGDHTDNDCAEVVIYAGLESLEHVDSLEHDDVDPAPLLDKLEHQADQ